MNDAKPAGMIGVLGDIRAERYRQIAKGYDADHDDKRDNLAIIAGSLAVGPVAEEIIALDDETEYAVLHIMDRHPNRREQLLIAATLLVAELERLDRRSTPAPAPEPA